MNCPKREWSTTAPKSSDSELEPHRRFDDALHGKQIRMESGFFEGARQHDVDFPGRCYGAASEQNRLLVG